MDWTVPPIWRGEHAFIIGGGPSVASQPVVRLQGRRTIAINSSYQLAPWADFFIFSDFRWWDLHRRALADRLDRVVAVANAHIFVPAEAKKLLKTSPKKIKGEWGPIELSRDPFGVAMLWTTMSAALNLALHLGAERAVALGLDGSDAQGRSHHVPHPWPVKPEHWEYQRDEISALAPQLAAAGLDVVNVSPITRLTCFRQADLAVFM